MLNSAPLRLAIAGGIVTAAVAVIVLVGDVTSASGAFSNLDWTPIAALIPVTIAAYAARYLRWKALIEIASGVRVQHRAGGAAFAAGSLLIFTPARAGEAAKSLYARDMIGIPIAESLPVLAAERVNDVAVMVVLAAVGLIAVGALANLAALAIAGAAVLAAVAVVLGVLRKITARPRRRDRFGAVEFISRALSVGELLLGRRAMRVNSGYGLVAWAGEVVVYYLALAAVAEPFGGDTFLLAMAIYPLASLGGALSLVPAGLGVTEGGLVGLGVVIGDVGGEQALAAALIARAAVLGGVVLFGLASLPLLRTGRQAAARGPDRLESSRVD